MAGHGEQSSAEFIQHHMTNLKIGEGFWSLHLDTLFFSILLGGLFCWWLRRMALKAHAGVPSFGLAVAEMLFEFVDNTVKDFFGKSRSDIGSLALTIFVWVLLWNTMDIIPINLFPDMASMLGIHYLKIVPSTDSNATFALSITVVTLTYIYTYKHHHGLWGFIKALGGHPFEAESVVMKVLLYPINFAFSTIENVAKIISLSLRLFGNFFAGELVFILIALLPAYIQFIPGGAWAIFHILVIILQAYLFMVLSLVYLSSTQAHH